MRDLLEGYKKEFKYLKFEIKNTYIRYDFSEVIIPFSVKKIKKTLDKTIELLGNEKIFYEEKCGKCKKNIKTKFYQYDSVGIRLCPVCYEKENIEIEKKKEEYRTEKKYYLRGFLISIVFGLPSILLGGFFYVVLKKITLIVPIAALGLFFLGYKCSKAKYGYITPIIGFIVTYFYSLLSVFTNIYFWFKKNGLNLDEMKNQMMLNSKFNENLEKEFIWMSIMSLFIVIPYTIYIAKQMNIPKIKNVKYV